MEWSYIYQMKYKLIIVLACFLTACTGYKEQNQSESCPDKNAVSEMQQKLNKALVAEGYTEISQDSVYGTAMFIESLQTQTSENIAERVDECAR